MVMIYISDGKGTERRKYRAKEEISPRGHKEFN
jgi:hypothetical protein